MLNQPMSSLMMNRMFGLPPFGAVAIYSLLALLSCGPVPLFS
jgi:hypothetical protein